MITINNFQKGLASSPYISNGAFSKNQNLDVISLPGIARIGYLPTNISATSSATFSALPQDYTIDSNGVLYMSGLDTVVKVDYTTPAITSIIGTGGTAAPANKRWVEYWEGYLFCIGTTVVKTSAIATPDTWTTFQTIDNSTHHYMFSSPWDGNLYVANVNKLGRLAKVGATFDPTNAATYSWDDDAFVLPVNYTIIGISEIDNCIVLACISGTSGATTYFFWDRAKSTSEFIYEINESGITNILHVGRTIYATGGSIGNIYKVGLFGVNKWKQLPFDYDDNKTITTAWGSFTNNMVWWLGNLYLGIGQVSTGNSSVYPQGIYCIGDSTHHCFIPSTGKTGETESLQIGAMAAIGTTLVYSWKSTDSYGIDKINLSSKRVTSYSSYFESLFYPVGLSNEKKSFDRVEVQLARPLQTGEGIQIKYRKNINDSWTTLGTQTYTTNGAVSSLMFPGIHNCENIQIRVELTTGASSQNTPYLKEVHLI